MNANPIKIMENGVETVYNLVQDTNATMCIQMNPEICFTEQPVEYHRFRYVSDKGTHGRLYGRSNTMNNNKNNKKNNKKMSYPKFKILNYNGKVLIKVKLYTKLSEKEYREHVHKLKGSPYCKEDGTYEKTQNINESSVIELDQLYIEMVRIQDIQKTLEQRYRNSPKDSLSKYIKHLKSHINEVYLGIEVYKYGEPISICMGFSERINNSKNSIKLKIYKISKPSGKAKGGADRIILCDKVDKKDIKVRFFKDNWEAFGDFAEPDVHHQVAISLRIPPYENRDIEDMVKVQMELIKPSTEEKSSPVDFYYRPDSDEESIKGKKRKRKAALSSDPERTERDLDFNSAGASGNLQVNVEDKMDTNMEEAPNTSEFDLSNAMNQNSHNPVFTSAALLENEIQISIDEELFKAIKDGPLPLLDYKDMEELNKHSDGSLSSLDDMDMDKYLDIVSDSLPSEKVRNKTKGIHQLVKRGVNHVNDQTISTDKQAAVSKIIKVDPGESKVKDLLKRDPVTGYKLLYQLAEQTYIALQKYAKTSQVKFLLEAMGRLMVIPDENGDNAIHNAVIHADSNSTALFNLVAVAEHLPAKLDCLNMFNDKIQTPLHIAVHVDSPSMVKGLLEHGADPNLADRHGNSALHLACLHGKYDIVQVLLNAENYSKKYEEKMPSLKNFNYDGFAPLHLAVRSQSLECVKEVCVAGADINETEHTIGKTAIHMAVELRNVEILKELLKYDDVDVNIQAFNGCSSLHLACSLGDLQIVKLLMDAKADPYIENFNISQYDESSDEETDENLKNINHEEIHGYNSFDLARNNPEILEILTGENSSGTEAKFEVEERINPSEEHKNNKCFNHLNDSAVDDLQDSTSQSKLSDTYNDLCSEFSYKVNLHSDENSKINESVDSGALTPDSDISAVDSGIVLSDAEGMDEETKVKLASLLDPSGDWKKLAKNSKLEYLCSMIENMDSPTLSLLPYLQDVNQLRKELEILNLHQALDVVDDYLKKSARN